MMHVWGEVDLRIYLAKKNHGYSISAQSYDFCPHLIQLDILDFTLSCMLRGLFLTVSIEIDVYRPVRLQSKK